MRLKWDLSTWFWNMGWGGGWTNPYIGSLLDDCGPTSREVVYMLFRPNKRWAMMREKKGTNNPHDLWVLIIEVRSAQENAMLISWKEPLTNQIHSRHEHNACDPLNENNSIVEHLHEFSSQYVQTIIDYHLALGACNKLSLFLTTYMQDNSLKIQECPNITLNLQCEHKVHYCMSIKEHFTCTKINIFDIHARFALKWQVSIGVNSLAWTPNTTKTWPLPTFISYFHTL